MNNYKLHFIASIVLLFFFTNIKAQSDTTYWKRGAKGTLTFTQTSLTNWAAGGENSITINGFLSTFANYTKGNVVWENSLELGYGLISQGKVDVRKSDDKIIFTTKYGHKINEKISWSSILDFKSQFHIGYKFDKDGKRTKISDFMAPGYLTISTGLEWIPSDDFHLIYSPITGKITFVSSQLLANQGAFGVEKGIKDTNGNYTKLGERTRFELGSFIKLTLKKNIAKNVSLESKLELFTNYDTFGKVDVNWQNDILMKINDWLSASFITQLIYDDDIASVNDEGVKGGPKIQYKQILGVGLAYTIGDKK